MEGNIIKSFKLCCLGGRYLDGTGAWLGAGQNQNLSKICWKFITDHSTFRWQMIVQSYGHLDFSPPLARGLRPGNITLFSASQGNVVITSLDIFVWVDSEMLCFRVIETETSRFSNNPRFFVLVSEKLEDLNCKVNQFWHQYTIFRVGAYLCLNLILILKQFCDAFPQIFSLTDCLRTFDNW